MDSYIAEATLRKNFDVEAHSMAMAYLIKRYLSDTVTTALATDSATGTRKEQVQQSLADDFSALAVDAQIRTTIEETHSLHEVLKGILPLYKSGSFQRKYVEFLINRTATEDVVINNAELFGIKGVVRFSSEAAPYIDINLRSENILNTITHEATHVYFFKNAHKFERTTTKPDTITDDEWDFLRTAHDLFKIVHRKPVRDTSRYPIGSVTGKAIDGKNYTPYGTSSLTEFVAELYSNEHFRQWVAEEVSYQRGVSLSTSKNWLRTLFSKFLKIVGIELTNKQLTEFLESGLQFFSKTPERLDSRTNAYLKDTTRAQEDEYNGVRYYTFKRRTAFGEPQLAGSARFDEDTGTWEFNYADENNNAITEDGLSIDEVINKALDLDMQVYGRSGIDSPGHFLQSQINRTMLTHPRLSKILESVRFGLMRFLSEDAVNKAMAHIYNAALTFEHYAMNRDALHIWLDRALQAIGADPKNAQNILNTISAKTATFLNERGLNGEQTLADHKIAIKELANRFGVNKEQLNDIVYALTAKHRKEAFENNPGEIDPYTGEYTRDTSKVSGFWFTDKQGNKVQDDDGSKYLASLDANQQIFANQLEQLWIAQNNSVLDFEYQAGAISKDQYESQYGKFYAPLRNADSQATAFYKRALGRTTKAADPATNYYNFANARIMYAQHQMKMGQLLDTALTENVQSVIEVNQAHFVQTGDGLKRKWTQANRQDPAVITVWRDNTRYTMRITDEHIANAIRKASNRQMTGIWAVLAGVTRSMSLVRTSLSPTFVPVAFARDVLTAVGNVQAAFRDLGTGSLSDAQAREISGRIPATAMKAALSILRNNAKGIRSWEYDVFKRVGGGITMNARYDFEQANEWLNTELTTARDGTPRQMGTGLKSLKQGLKKATEISHAFEDATRFAAFMEYLKLKNGGREFANEQELVTFLTANPEVRAAAVTGSKNITGNFEIKGANVGFRSLYMFFNASMVGLSTTVNMFDPRHGVHGVKYGAMLAGAMLASMVLMDADMGDDEDGKSKLSRVPKVGDSLCAYGVCLPVPHEARFVTNFVKSAYHMLRGDYSLGEATANTMHGILQAGSPMQFDGFYNAQNSMHTLVQNIVPTLGQLPVQLATGLNSFGKEIVPEYAYTANGQRIVDAMDWQKSKMSDPDWTKWTAMNLQKLLGIDISSSELDHTAQFVLGSVYTAVKRMGRGVAEGAPTSDILLNAVGRGFVGEYDSRAMVDSAKAELKKLKAEITMGDSVDNMLRASDDLKQDPRYAKLVALERSVENAERNLRYNGKSYSELYRQKQRALVTDDIDAILESNEGIDYLNYLRREVYGKFYDELEYIREGIE